MSLFNFFPMILFAAQSFESLVTELKIMVNLGQHLNVLNLLGAVTKNIAQCE